MDIREGDRSAPVPVVRQADDVPAQSVAAGRDTTVQVLVGPDDGATNYVLRRFRMEGELPRLHPLIDLCKPSKV